MIITLSLPPSILNPNRAARVSWHKITGPRKKYREEAAAVAKKAIRAKSSAAWTKEHRRPGEIVLPWTEATVQVSCYWPTRLKRDRLNIYQWMKPAFDGLADAGLIVDDSGLAPLEPRFSIDKKNPRVEIEILERKTTAKTIK